MNRRGAAVSACATAVVIIIAWREHAHYESPPPAMPAHVPHARFVAPAPPAAPAANAEAEVEKVVRANLAAAYTSHSKLDATATKDLVFEPAVDENRRVWWDGRCGSSYCNDDVMLFGDWIMVDLELAPFTPTIVIDDSAHVAFFAADLVFSGTLATGNTVRIKGKWPVRVTGIVVDDHGWKVAAEKFSLVTDDATLLSADDYAPYADKLDDPPAVELAAWFPGHLADHQSARAFRATGTADGDVASDRAAMTRLARSWDKLALTPKSAEFTPLANGKVAWAEVTVTLPTGTLARVKIMTVGIIAVREADTWRWVSLNWSPRVQPHEATH
jgi:hypothetical protein